MDSFGKAHRVQPVKDENNGREEETERDGILIRLLQGCLPQRHFDLQPAFLHDAEEHAARPIVFAATHIPVHMYGLQTPTQK